MATRYVVALLIAVGTLAGCAEGPLKEIPRMFERKGEPQLKAGIKYYEEARLPQAAREFEGALSAGLNDTDQVTAHKYLAFIHCVSRRERQCRAHFRSALELNPQFELGAAEAGHPMWGPVFKSVKSGR